jgi:AraC family transcriptional regulator of adaptative response/methylated-DNA-[protein]-cysteine methyltransferase
LIGILEKITLDFNVHFSVDNESELLYPFRQQLRSTTRSAMGALPSRNEMERAYRTSDPAYDGVFYLGVKTTGVFCRPSCGARKPIGRNVEYFATPREALFAGYRPCKRCAPLSAIGTPPRWVDRLIDAVERTPWKRLKDAELRALGIDPARARRFFRRNHGMTFQSYCRSRRLGQALKQIRRGDRIDDVALGFGYDSHSGFREAFRRTFGTPPGRARSTLSITVMWLDSPLGPLIAGATDTELVLLEFTDRRMLDRQFAALRRYFKRPIVPGTNPVLAKTREELKRYFAGELRKFTLPMNVPGTDFQRRVWKGLQEIPYGKTISYDQLARKIGVPRALRAVGHSNGLNRIAIVLPCHRVVNKRGTLGGYGGGLWRKRALLELERGERRYGVSGDSSREDAPPFPHMLTAFHEAASGQDPENHS